MLFASVALRGPKLLGEICCLLIAMAYLKTHYGMNIFERNLQSVVGQSAVFFLDGVIQQNLFTKGKVLTKCIVEGGRLSYTFCY